MSESFGGTPKWMRPKKFTLHYFMGSEPDVVDAVSMQVEGKYLKFESEGFSNLYIDSGPVSRIDVEVV